MFLRTDNTYLPVGKMKSYTILALLFSTTVLFAHAFDMPGNAAPSNLMKRLISRSVSKSQSKEMENGSDDLQLSPHRRSQYKVPSMIRKHMTLVREEISSEVMATNDPSVGSEWDTVNRNDSMQFYHNYSNGSYIETAEVVEHDESSRLKHGMCKSLDAPLRSIALKSEYHGPYEKMAYIDGRHSFFKFAMGFSAAEVNESMMSALEHFRNEFNVDFDMSKSTYDDMTGKYMIPAMGLTFAPVVYDGTYEVVADSYTTTSCIDIVGVMGGWMLEQENMTVKGVRYEGKVSLMNFFIVFNPGTRYSTRLAFFATLPKSCDRDGSCPICGWTYNLDYYGFGWLDGVSIYENDDKYGFSSVFRGVAMWPGRAEKWGTMVDPFNF